MKNNLLLVFVCTSFALVSCQKKSEDKPVAPRFSSGTAAIEHLDSLVYGMKACTSKISEIKVGAELKDYEIEMKCGLKSFYPTVASLNEIIDTSSEVLASGLTLSQKNYVTALVKVAQETLPIVRAAHDAAIAGINSTDSLQAYLTANDYKIKVTLHLNPNDLYDKTTAPTQSEMLLILEAIERAGSDNLNSSIVDEIVVIEKSKWSNPSYDFVHAFQNNSDFFSTTSSSAAAVFTVSTRMIYNSLNDAVTQLVALPKRKGSPDAAQLKAMMNKLNVSTIKIEHGPQKITSLIKLINKLNSLGLIFQKPATFTLKDPHYGSHL